LIAVSTRRLLTAPSAALSKIFFLAKRGSRNKATLLLEQILADDAEAIIKKAIELAKDGDPIALRLCMERLLPRRKQEPIECELPPIEKAQDTLTALTAISGAVGTGDVTPSEAAALGKVVNLCVKALEMIDVDARLTRIEEHQARNRQAMKQNGSAHLP
jgi:hypothetical protein